MNKEMSAFGPSKGLHPWESVQDWNNQSLEPFHEMDSRSKRTKVSKNSKMGSREGSRKAKKRINKIASIQFKREKNSQSRQDKRRIIRNKVQDIAYNEFKQDDKFNKAIGINENEIENAKTIGIVFDPQDILIDDSHLDEAISYHYSLGDRSFSLSKNSKESEQEDEVEQENFIEIVEQNSFDKLEAYRDRLPFLSFRKFLLRIRRLINKSALMIISNPIFEYTSLGVIVANSISLTLYDPTNPDASNTGFLGSLDTVFLVLYSTEMVLKILGLGFIFNKGAYLRESWNILDFVIVLSAYLQLMVSSGANLSVLRSFRVLRPLRTISGIEGLRVIVTALMKAVTLLVDTVIILLFFFIIFAIAGVQLFGGILKKRCVNINTGQILDSIDMCGSVDCPEGYLCGKTNSNPNYGVTNFDNIFYSLLMVFQSVTLEGWTYNMIFVEKAFNWISFVFFIPLIFIGAFFLLNLTLVVIKSKFSEEHEENKQKKRRQHFIMKKVTKEDIEREKEARKALKRIRVKSKKIYMSKVHRKDSDDSLAQK